MMYVSVYPISISIRNSNVYEERSLGIYSEDQSAYATLEKRGVGPLSWLKGRFTGPGQEQTKWYFVQQQLRAQLAHDLWWLVLAVFFIMIIEGGQFEKRPDVFSVFNVLFEVVSGENPSHLIRTPYLSPLHFHTLMIHLHIKQAMALLVYPLALPTKHTASPAHGTNSANSSSVP
jgi:hypothetical protein